MTLSATAITGNASLPCASSARRPDHPGGGLLRAAEDALQKVGAPAVEHAHEVGAVVDREPRLRVEHGVDVAVVGLRILARPGEDSGVAN